MDEQQTEDRHHNKTQQNTSHLTDTPSNADHDASYTHDENEEFSLDLPAVHDQNADDSRTEDSILHHSLDREDDDAADDDDAHRQNNQTILEEKEMQRKLMDIESSFLPEPSTIEMAATQNAGADDTYLVGVPSRDHEEDSYNRDISRIQAENSISELPRIVTHDESEELAYNPADPTTTPATNRESELNTSALETLTSSPTAAAAQRTVSRALSNTSRNTQEGAFADSADIHRSLTPRKSRRNLSPAFSDTRRSREAFVESTEEDNKPSGSQSKRSRPKYLSSRQSSHRFSTSSITSTNTDATSSDATLGADYALQTGGAVSSRATSMGRKDLSRTISLGSMASGVSALSEENVLDRRVLSGATDGGLHTLDEEDTGSVAASRDTEDNAPVTPRAGSKDLNLPTDTVVAQHVQDIQVPGTFAREFHAKFSTNMSPDKRAGAPTPAFGRSGKSMTLKEQSSTIDRLSKENFDLKMRIHFLNEALNKRSEEGVKEMISENVELKSDKIKLQKENQGMKRTIRNLEKQLKDSQSTKGGADTEGETSEDDKRNDVEEEELIFLRERIETYETEIERLRTESIVRESEKRRLAEIVKSMGDNRPAGSEAGAREEREMWKDMLDAETAAREQAEDENRKLRDEILRMREGNATGSEAGRFGRTGRKGSFISHSTTSERDHDRRLAVPSSTSSTLVEIELLKKENAELRREVSVQTSMLTSRNREKERLYQEIEDLKLQRRDGGRSIAGDSIFERSASRAHARSSSRASNGTRESRISDTERESLEVRNGELRDQVSTLKLENQGLRSQLDEYTAELEALDKAYQADVDQAEEEMQILQQERDQALQVAEEREAALQDLKAEAQEEIDTLGDELDQKVEECNRMEMTLRTQEENLKTLQAEMRSASEGILRLEEDAQSNLRKFKQVQQELEDSNREIESLEKNLFEANGKVQRLTVQIESSQGEITFLREEQDADKIRISELDSEIKSYKINLQVEKEKTKELETRLAEERHQREVVGSKEKQEVQRIMNDLNREASAAKDEIRRLKKTLSAREIDAATWKERLMELENGLREAVGDLNGTRSSLLNSVIKLQKELESKSLDLESTRSKLDEKESLLQSREALLESHGLESRKLGDLLDRERQARRADKHSFDQALKSQQQASRTISQHNSRISDLEAARSQDRKRFASLEQQLKDQLSERNALYLTLWKRLSAMCGPDWAHSNSLINGNLPSVEVIGNILFWPGFSRNLLLSVKTVENMLSGFRTRIRQVERDLTKEYQSLEHNFGVRVKKLERLEEAVRNIRSQQRAAGVSPEVTKLKGEVRLLKAELNLIQSNASSRRTGSNLSHATTAVDQEPLASPISRTQSTLVRSDSRGKKGTLSRNPSGMPQSSTTLVETSSQRNPKDSDQDNVMIQRLRELERRLKNERVARLADRDGARKRLEERDAENEELRAELERERMRRSTRGTLEPPPSLGRGNSQRKTSTTLVVDSGPTSSGEDDKRTSGSDNEDTDAHSSYGEGITVELEM